MDFRKLLAEFIGTFYLVMSICIAIQSGKILSVSPLVYGFMLIALTYAFMRISESHFNPTVSLVAFFNNKITINIAVAYLATQIVASVFAAYAANAILQGMETENINLPIQIDIIPAFLAEFFGTFALVSVLLSTNIKDKWNGFSTMSVGAIVIGCSYIFGAITGGFFNPAITIAAGINGIIEWNTAWVYFLAQIVGGFMAAISFKFLNAHNEDKTFT